MAYTDVNSEDRLVQATFAEHLCQQWYFGMKLHIGVDSRTGLAHSAVGTAANVHDKHPLPHGQRPRAVCAAGA